MPIKRHKKAGDDVMAIDDSNEQTVSQPDDLMKSNAIPAASKERQRRSRKKVVTETEAASAYKRIMDAVRDVTTKVIPDESARYVDPDPSISVANIDSKTEQSETIEPHNIEVISKNEKHELSNENIQIKRKSKKIKFKVAHKIHGRMRIKIMGATYDSGLLEIAANSISAIPEVKDIKIKMASSSLIIKYVTKCQNTFEHGLFASLVGSKYKYS